MLAALSDHRLTDVVRSAVLLCPIAYLNRMKSKLILLAARIFLAEVKQRRTNLSELLLLIRMAKFVYLCFCIMQTIHMLGYHEFNPVG